MPFGQGGRPTERKREEESPFAPNTTIDIAISPLATPVPPPPLPQSKPSVLFNPDEFFTEESEVPHSPQTETQVDENSDNEILAFLSSEEELEN